MIEFVFVAYGEIEVWHSKYEDKIYLGRPLYCGSQYFGHLMVDDSLSPSSKVVSAYETMMFWGKIGEL